MVQFFKIKSNVLLEENHRRCKFELQLVTAVSMYKSILSTEVAYNLVLACISLINVNHYKLHLHQYLPNGTCFSCKIPWVVSKIGTFFFFCYQNIRKFEQQMEQVSWGGICAVLMEICLLLATIKSSANGKSIVWNELKYYNNWNYLFLSVVHS